jgi:hypothetical protein
MLHERHSFASLTLARLIATLRLLLARSLGASPQRLAREGQRLATAQGMLEGARAPRP